MAELPRRIIKVRCAPSGGRGSHCCQPGLLIATAPLSVAVATPATFGAYEALRGVCVLQETKRLLQEPGVRSVEPLLVFTFTQAGCP